MNSDEILKATLNKLGDALKKKNLNTTDRITLEVLQVIIIYMMDDHPKTQLMYNVFRPLSWIVAIATTSIIGLIVTGKVSIILGS